MKHQIMIVEENLEECQRILVDSPPGNTYIVGSLPGARLYYLGETKVTANTEGEHVTQYWFYRLTQEKLDYSIKCVADALTGRGEEDDFFSISDRLYDLSAKLKRAASFSSKLELLERFEEDINSDA